MKNQEDVDNHLNNAVAQFTSALISNEKLPKISFQGEEVFSTFYKTIVADILQKNLSEPEQHATLARLVSALSKHTDERGSLPAIANNFIVELSESFDLPTPPSAWDLCKQTLAGMYAAVKEHPWLIGAGILTIMSPVAAAAFASPIASTTNKEYDASLVAASSMPFSLATIEHTSVASSSNATHLLPIAMPENTFFISLVDVEEAASLAKFSVTEIIEQHRQKTKKERLTESLVNAVFATDGKNLNEIEMLLDVGAQINLDAQRPYYVSGKIRHGNLVSFLLDCKHYNIFKLLLEKTDQMLVTSQPPFGKNVVSSELYYALIAGVDDRTLEKILARLQRNNLALPGNDRLVSAHKQFSIMSPNPKQQKYNTEIIKKYCPSIDFDHCLWDAYTNRDIETISHLLSVIGKQDFSNAVLQKIKLQSIRIYKILSYRRHLVLQEGVRVDEEYHRVKIAILVDLFASMLEYSPEKSYKSETYRKVDDANVILLQMHLKCLMSREEENRFNTKPREEEVRFNIRLRQEITEYSNTDPYQLSHDWVDKIEQFNLLKVLKSYHVVDVLAKYPNTNIGQYFIELFFYITETSSIMAEYHPITLDLLTHFHNNGYSQEMLTKLANAVPETDRIQYLLSQGISHEILPTEVYAAVLDTLKDTHWVQLIDLTNLSARTPNTVISLSVRAYDEIINSFLYCLDFIEDNSIPVLLVTVVTLLTKLLVCCCFCNYSLYSENASLNQRNRELQVTNTNFFNSYETLFNYSPELNDYLQQFEGKSAYTDQIEELGIEDLPENIPTCPIMHDCPNKPILLDGVIFDFDALISSTNSDRGWLNPMTNRRFYPRDIQPAREINNKIQNFIQEKQAKKLAARP